MFFIVFISMFAIVVEVYVNTPPLPHREVAYILGNLL